MATGKKKGKKATWHEPSSYDRILAQRSTDEGRRIVLPNKVAHDFRFFQVWPCDPEWDQFVKENPWAAEKK